MYVSASVIGIVTNITALDFKERRKMMATTIANNNPIQILSLTLLIDLLTKSACI